MVHLLKAKVKLPPTSKGHTPRQRLIEKIHQHQDAPIVLLSAPAGFGKTSCLLEWAHVLKENDTGVVWYALDEQDNDPAQFAFYRMYAFEMLDSLAAQEYGLLDKAYWLLGLARTFTTVYHKFTT